MSDKVCLWLGGGLVAVLLLGALGYAGWTNVGQWLERFAQEQEAQQAAREAEEKRIHEINAQRLKDWEAYWKTPEGQEVKRKEGEARDRQARAVWVRWELARDAVCRDGIRVRSTSDPTELFVIMPGSLVNRMSEYELKKMAQNLYQILGGNNCRVYIHDDSGLQVANAWMWGASSSK